eukprot:s1296_g8.t2
MLTAVLGGMENGDGDTDCRMEMLMTTMLLLLLLMLMIMMMTMTALAHVALLRSVQGAAEAPQLRYLAVRCNDRPVALLPAFHPTHDVYRAELEFAEPGFAIDAVPAEGSEFANADEFSSTKLVEPGGEVRNNLDVRTSHGSGLTTYSVQIMRHSGEEVLLRDLTFPGVDESQPSFTPHNGNYTVLMPAELDRLEVNLQLWDSGQSLEVTAHSGLKSHPGSPSGQRQRRCNGDMGSPRFRVPWCAIKVGPFNWYCLVEGEGSEEERSTSKSARPCVGWVQVIAGVLGAVLLIFVLKLLVERKVFQIYHTEQVLGGLGAGYAVVRSGILIYRHCKRASSGLQRFALRILGVVPIFAVDAWIDLWLEGSNSGFVMLLHCIREIAEAVAVCSFVQLLLSFLGGPVQLSNSLLEQEQPPVDQLGLLQFCVPPYRPGPSFVSKVIISILQYSLVTPCLFLMTTIVWRSLKDPDLARLHRGLLHLHALPPLFKGVSCLCAMYHLVLLQRETRPHLEKFLKLNPALKFCSLHCIVFLTFWQSFAVDAVASYVRWAQSQEEHHNPQSELSRERFLESLKGLLLCLEMPSFCEIHFCAYPPDEMEEAQRNAYVVAGQSAPRRSGSGHWELEQDENVPVLLRAKDGNDQAPDVSRLMSAEEQQVSVATDTPARFLRLRGGFAARGSLGRGARTNRHRTSRTRFGPQRLSCSVLVRHVQRLLALPSMAFDEEPRWTFTTAAPYWDPSFMEKLSRPEASNGESLKPRTQVVAKDALNNKGRRLLLSGETQLISVQRFFPVEVNGSRLVQIRVFPANRNTTLNRMYHIHAFRQPCPPQRPFYAPDVRLCAMTCNDGYFPRHASSRCEACPEHCARCSSYERCEVCKPSQWQTLYFLQHVGGQCHVLRIHLHELGIGLVVAVAVFVLCTCFCFACCHGTSRRPRGRRPGRKEKLFDDEELEQSTHLLGVNRHGSSDDE